jgi:hypothetical protein
MKQADCITLFITAKETCGCSFTLWFELSLLYLYDTMPFGRKPIGQTTFSQNVMLVETSEPVMLPSIEEMGAKLGEGMWATGF